MEFDDLRPYVTGDDARHIDWRTSARHQSVHTRLYREETDLPITVVVDLRTTMFTGSTRLRAVSAGVRAADLLWRAAAGGHRTNLVTLGDCGLGFSPPASGERGALEGCRVLADAFDAARRQAGQPAPEDARDIVDDSDGNSATLASLLDEVLDANGRRGTSILLSGLDSPGEDLSRALLRHVQARSLAIVQIRDPLERETLPAARYRYHGHSGSNTVSLDQRSCLELSASLAVRQQQKIRLCDAAGVLLIDADTGTSAILRQLREHGLLA